MDLGCIIYIVMKSDFVYDVIKLMVEKGIGVLLVVDGDDIVGIVIECDYVCKVVL